MSVQITHYVILGTKLTPEERDQIPEDVRDNKLFYDSAFKSEVTAEHLAIIQDMDSVTLVGEIIEKAAWEHGEGLEPTPCVASEHERQEVQRTIKEELGLDLPLDRIQVWAWSRFS